LAGAPLSEQLLFNPETKPYWEGCAQGRLMLTRCLDTGAVFAYPRAISPFTLSSNVEWFEASGAGEIYSLSRILSPEGVYTIAYVSLDEGPTILSGLVDDDDGLLQIGDRVRAVFREVEGGHLAPFFAPNA
jgi:uncharacterized OB-fold protein